MLKAPKLLLSAGSLEKMRAAYCLGTLITATLIREHVPIPVVGTIRLNPLKKMQVGMYRKHKKLILIKQ
jgi:hypothetical protein